jgi:LuxR family transcriptional regulator, maltose regulon positive regulatory protein
MTALRERLDRRTEAISAYRRLRQTLSVTLGIAPSAASEKLFQTLR